MTRTWRQAAAVLIAGVALAAAFYVGSAKLGHGLVDSGKGDLGLNDIYAKPILRADREDWQIPVAILVASVGFASALAVARVRR